jgi:hypothetical protein
VVGAWLVAIYPCLRRFPNLPINLSLPAGTQVVSRIEVKNSAGDVVRLSGSVGVIVQTLPEHERLKAITHHCIRNVNSTGARFRSARAERFLAIWAALRAAQMAKLRQRQASVKK